MILIFNCSFDKVKAEVGAGGANSDKTGSRHRAENRVVIHSNNIRRLHIRKRSFQLRLTVASSQRMI